MRNIDELILHFNNNQTKVAKALGVNPQNVSHWFRKMDDMPLEFVPKAAKILGKSIYDLRPDVFHQ